MQIKWNVLIYFLKGKHLLHTIATIFLLPILFIQGLYVKWATPKLPEATGARAGIFGFGHKIALLIVGDSATAGVGVNTQEEAFVGQLVSSLSPEYEISWKLIAQTGLKAKDIVERLRSADAESFDVALLSVGVNDVTRGTGANAWRVSQLSLIKLLKEKFGCRHVFLSGIPPMHLFPALPQPLRWWLGVKAKKFNQILKMICEEERCTLVQMDLPFEKEYMAEDGFHPGASAYAIWGRYTAEVIRQIIKQAENLQTAS
ncbi:MAG TPA: SGNH/GDSL hydrolase family protein [Smithellaceae bacterium]|nr:SGNH/GDSL hydrolase family protein [Smithellaceae bacterium]HRV25929.1 SGNH/GDSL hydrolase family protein [Smithellaceae bacterium]